MRALTKIAITFLLAAIALTAFASVEGQSSAIEAAQTATQNAYTAIVTATNAGADTTQLIDQLNQAINLTEQAQQQLSSNPDQATTIATQAQTIAQNITQQANTQAETAQNTIPVIPITIAAAAIAIGVAIFLLGPKFLWKAWFKLRKNFKVKVSKTKKKEAVFLTAEQLCAIILAITVVIAFISVSEYLPISTSGEQFSELGILGPNMQLGDYPSKVVASETVSLYGYVGNQMATPMYYTVKVQLGNNQTAINPATSATTIQEYSQVLPNNGTWTFPISITLTEPGDNQRIIFELWAYNQSTNQVLYQERWGQIWVNVTAPAT